MVDLNSLQPVQAPSYFSQLKKVTKPNLATLKPKTYYGSDAVQQVEKREGRSLSLAERRVVEEEGFVDGFYKDDKGIETGGVGQTGKWKGKSFTETFEAHREDAVRLIDNFDTLPESLQAEFIQATYRGDLRQSEKTRELFNSGKYKEAAKELLNNKDYKTRKAKKDDGVTRRLEALSNEILKYDSTNQPTP